MTNEFKKKNKMTLTIKQLLVTSSTLLVIHTTMAQSISGSSSLTLEQGVTCLDWAKKEQSFSNQLAMGDWAIAAFVGAIASFMRVLVR